MFAGRQLFIAYYLIFIEMEKIQQDQKTLYVLNSLGYHWLCIYIKKFCVVVANGKFCNLILVNVWRLSMPLRISVRILLWERFKFAFFCARMTLFGVASHVERKILIIMGISLMSSDCLLLRTRKWVYYSYTAGIDPSILMKSVWFRSSRNNRDPTRYQHARVVLSFVCII